MYQRRHRPTSSTTLSSVPQTRTLQLYNPLPTQLKAHQSNKRFNILCFGRQSGKTTFGLNDVSDKAWRGLHDGVYWYILQTYDAAQVAFKRMFKFYKASPLAFDKKPNESDLTCRYKHGPEISFKSGKNYQDLRVETLDGVVIDEYRQQPPELWPMVIRPMLGAKKGWADILSTPNGFDHFKDLFDFAVDHPEEWGAFHAPSTEAPWWTPEEIQSAKGMMSEDEFAQEILAEFREIGVGKVYKSHGSYNQLAQNPFSITGQQWSQFIPIIVGLDFNVGLMVWELLQNRGADFYYGDEIAVKNTDSEECAKLLVEKVKGHKPGVILIGDSSGNARKTSAVGKTDYTIIKKVLSDAGIKHEDRTPSDNPPVKDRINCMNGAMKAADGSIHLWYNPLCKYLKRDFERVKWKDGTDGAVLDKADALATHASDAGGYPVAFYSALLRKHVGTLKVISR